MENQSILDQILTNNQVEEVARLDAIELINNLLSELTERERDILVRRFGLHGKNKETLEEIGNVHELTRERIRQIETTTIKKLKQLKNLEEHITGLKKVINQLLTEHGGLMEKDYLFNSLANISVDSVKSSAISYKKDSKANAGEKLNSGVHKSHFDFLISKLLRDEFEEVSASPHFKNSYKLKYQALDHMEALAEELLLKIKELKKIFTTEELISLAKSLSAYKNHEDKFNAPGIINLTEALANELFAESADLINENKAVYSLLVSAKKIEQNKFGHWGDIDSKEIKPKTINDKIYLILKNHGKPLHFKDIAERINKISFDHKKANAATVHNELILDDKYVLVGRGLYGLKEWGFQKGAVIDVITHILKEAGEPLSRAEVVKRVLEQRLVRKATINLALMNKDKFERLPSGAYRLKQDKENS